MRFFTWIVASISTRPVAPGVRVSFAIELPVAERCHGVPLSPTCWMR